MKVIHISPIYNRELIMLHGIIPTKVKHKEHLKYFQERGLCTSDGRAIYTWQDSIYNEKFIRDMIFCKVWIHPRNDIYDTIPEEDYFDFRKVFDKNLCSYDNMIYDAYAAETINSDSYDYHIQTPSDNIFNTLWNMPEEYAHDNKRLFIFKTPLKNIQIIGQAQFYFDNNKYNIKILK